jgi:transmembrane sensor
METKNKYYTNWKLLASYLSGNASETEKNEVQEWIGKSEENKRLFIKVEKIWKISENTNQTEIDIEKAWKNVNSKAKILPRQRFFLMQKTYSYSLRVAAVLVIGIFAWYLISNINYLKTTTAGSKLVTLSLADGSQITLNNKAQLRYPNKFRGNSREVFLEGEAFFNITKNPQKPFIIKTSTTQIKVLGTSFSVNANRNGDVEVIVNSGVVAFKSGNNKQQVVLKKEDKAVFTKASGLINTSINSDPNYISWKTKKFIFRETRLKDVFDKIENIYSVRIIAKDTAIFNCRITATYDGLSIDDIIKSIDLAFKCKSAKNGDIFLIEGDDCLKR